MGLLVNCSQLHELGVKLGPGCPSTLVLAASVPQYTHPPDVQQGFMAASSRAETVKLELESCAALSDWCSRLHSSSERGGGD